MAYIKITSECPLFDGMPVTFKAPCDCTEVTGLRVYYNGASQTFTFKDAHGSTLTGIGNLFAQGAYVKVILDTTNGYSYIQNADTNKYIEDRFKIIEENGGGGGGSGGGGAAEEVLIDKIDFTHWEDEEFEVTYADGTKKSGMVAFDVYNRPKRITLNGHTLTITLPEVE